MKKISILYLEDDDLDVELIRDTLSSSTNKYSLFHVQNKSEFKIALKTMKFDIILADFNLPDIDGYGVLYIAKEITPDIPTIILSGTINEDVAIDTLKFGAVDYIFKSKLDKLLPALESAVRKGEETRRKRKFEKELAVSEAKFRTIFHSLTESVFIIDPFTGKIIDVNDEALINFGYERSLIIGEKIATLVEKGTAFPEPEALEQLYLTDRCRGESVFVSKDGKGNKKSYKIRIIPWEDIRVWMIIIIE
ncbi:MAG: response regulator [Candidatus Delongbacteria bacterium]|jgi:PAS domain S-box-containing protein|nr:response regulator [Candidatus Delongbacteria bacterium]